VLGWHKHLLSPSAIEGMLDSIKISEVPFAM